MFSPLEDKEVHLLDYLYVLNKRKRFIFLFLAASLLTGILWTSIESVLYKSTATVLIEKENPNIVDFKEVMTFDASSSEYYQTQYQLLRSQTLIQELIDTEKLEQDPYLRDMQKSNWRRFLQKFGWARAWLGQMLDERTLVDLFVNNMLDIEPVRNSRLVNVSVLHPDSVRSAEISNTLVRLFIQRNLKNRYMASQQATEMIAEQLDELRSKVARSEQKLQEYKEEKGLVIIPSIHEENEFLQDAKLELVKLQAEESKMAKRYLPAHPKRIHLRSQIEGLEEKLAEEQSSTLELSRAAIRYSELEREAESARKIYEALLERLEETHSAAKAQASNIMIIDRAVPLPRPYRPNPALNMLMALVLGLLGGVLLAYFVEYLDSTVKVPDDVEKGLGLNLFGIIPFEDRSRDNPLGGELFFTEGHSSPASESLRALRTSLLFKLRDVRGCRSVLVTSPNPEEGKSTIAINLAAAFQQNHLKVLLIDTDLRKPRLHNPMGVPIGRGVSDVLEGQAVLSDVIHRNIQNTGFDFMTAGANSHHPTEILGSEAMKDLHERLSREYDILIFDSSPYLAVADVVVLSEYAHQIVVVARYHRTDKRHLAELHRLIPEPAQRNLGVVINQVSVHERNYYYHRYYYYGYGENKPRR